MRRPFYLLGSFFFFFWIKLKEKKNKNDVPYYTKIGHGIKPHIFIVHTHINAPERKKET